MTRREKDKLAAAIFHAHKLPGADRATCLGTFTDRDYIRELAK